MTVTALKDKGEIKCHVSINEDWYGCGRDIDIVVLTGLLERVAKQYPKLIMSDISKHVSSASYEETIWEFLRHKYISYNPDTFVMEAYLTPDISPDTSFNEYRNVNIR